MNCFKFTIMYLKIKGLNPVEQWKDFDYSKRPHEIDDNTKFFLDNKMHYDFFNSFTRQIHDGPMENDIILHDGGVGVAINNKIFLTTNHIGMIVPKPIRKPCKIQRII